MNVEHLCAYMCVPICVCMSVSILVYMCVCVHDTAECVGLGAAESLYQEDMAVGRNRGTCG